jgi:hypothetical protein
MINQNVAIIGASSNPERYSHKAMLLLDKYGYSCSLINPKDTIINGNKVYATLSDIKDEVDTVTIYVGVKNQSGLHEQIVSKKCRRVIFNPGTENSQLEDRLKNSGIKVVRACTLIMLQTNTFE